MNTRTLFAALAATCLAILSGCDGNSLATASSNSSSNSPKATSLAFRLAPSLVKDSLLPGSKVFISIWGEDMPEAMNLSYPADTNIIVIPQIPVGEVDIVMTIGSPVTGEMSFLGRASVLIKPFQINRLSITLNRIDYATGGLLIDINAIQVVPPEDSAVYWKCQNMIGEYCQDQWIQRSSSVGPWNCADWSVVNGKRTCHSKLPVVDAPTTDGYCAKRMEGTPMLCTEPRRKDDPYYVPIAPEKIDSNAAWMIKPIVK